MSKFKKGNGGGPGRPPVTLTHKLSQMKREEMSQRILELLEVSKEALGDIITKGEGFTAYDVVVAKAILNSKYMTDVKVLLDTVFGPQKTPLELTGANGKPLFAKDPDLTGKKLTETIRTVKALMAAKRAGTIHLPGPVALAGN